MLILERKIGEKIVIEVNGKRVEVVLFDTQANRAKIGFIADPDVYVYRKEIQDRIDKENDNAKEKS